MVGGGAAVGFAAGGPVGAVAGAAIIGGTIYGTDKVKEITSGAIDKTDEQITETRNTIVDLISSVGRTLTAGGFGVLFVAGIVLMIPVLLLILLALVVVNFAFRLNDYIFEKIEEI